MAASDSNHPLGKPDPEIGWQQILADSPAPDGGNGPGHAQTYAWGETADSTPSTRLIPAAQAGVQVQAHTSVAAVIAAATWGELQYWAEMSLGPESFGLGVCYGIVRNFAGAIGGLLGLLKMFILADLYEAASHPPPWWKAWAAPRYWTAKGMQVMLSAQMKEAHEEVSKLRRQLARVLKNPLDYLGKAGANVLKGYQQKWKLYESLSTQTSLDSQFQAGELFGDVLTDIGLAILTVAAPARALAEIPDLLKVGETLRGVKTAEEIEGAAEAAKAAEAETEAAAPPPQETPKAPSSAAGNATDAEQISNGHAYKKHAAEFGNPSRAQFQDLVQNTIDDPSDQKSLLRGRAAYWSDNNEMVVITDPNSPDGGTAFRPSNGKLYFDGLK